MNPKNLEYIFWLKNLKGLGPVAVRSLIQHFGSSRLVFEASDAQIVDFIKTQKNLRSPMARAIVEGRDRMNSAQEEVISSLEKAEKFKAKIISIEDDDYPKILKNCIGEPPPILFVKGDLGRIGELSIAIVGTRKPTPRGLSFAKAIASSLVKDNWTVISGLAKGIDAAAHMGALSDGGNTIAILGCGVDKIYPSENKFIYEKISESGAVVSEFPFGAPPSAENLRRRNKTIVSFSLAIIVVEAPIDSGAMIAAKFAMDQKKRIFSLIPENIGQKEISGVLKLLSAAEAIPLELSPSSKDLIKNSVVYQDKTNVTWDRYITEPERAILRDQVEGMRQNWLMVTLEAQNESSEGYFTNQAKELRNRLQKLSDSGWHSVQLHRLDAIFVKKVPSTTPLGKTLRAKIIGALTMIADDIKSNLFMNQCKYRKELEGKTIKSIIFDLDGVVVDTRDVIKSAYERVICTFSDTELKHNILQSLICFSPKKVLRILLQDKYTDLMYEKYKTYFDEEIYRVKIPSSGKDTIQTFKNKGIAVGLITSQSKARMDKILALTKLDDLFMIKMHWGSTPNKKPHPEPLLKMLNCFNVKPSESIYIGDTAQDIDFARNAGVIPLIALWANTCMLDELLEHSPSYFLTNYNRLPVLTS
jgi:DNA processing protein